METYAPLVHRFLRYQGLQESDARDVAQEVFLSVASDIEAQKSRRPGAFRKWLYMIVRNRTSDYRRRNRRHPKGSGDTRAQQMLEQISSQAEKEEQEWDRAYLQHMFGKAAKMVQGDFQSQTWDAFWRTAVQDESAQAVAGNLQMSVAAVYMAKRRILKRIQEQIAFLEGETK